MKRFFLFMVTSVGLNMLMAKQALAVCPICTIAVAAGVGFSRYLGVDDTVTGVWIGGLTISMIMWTINWLEEKHWGFAGDTVIISTAYYLMVIVPLYYMGIMGHPLNSIPLFGLGVDKLLVGITVGTAAFWFGAAWYLELKIKNDNRAHFPFQKIAMPVGMLAIMSLVFYFLTK